MNDVVIRKASLKDASNMAELDRICFAQPWSRQAFEEELNDNSAAFYLVAEVSGTIIGYVGQWEIVGEGHITNVAVHPGYRNLGIGTKMLRELIGLSSEKGIGCHTLEVRKSNEEAISLYKKFGFKIAGIRKEYYADNLEDALILWRGL